MFYQKTLRNLRADLKTLQDGYDLYYKEWNKAVDALRAVRAELEDARLEVRGYDEQVAFLTDELARNKEINESLSDINRDQSRRLELHESVLQQLDIPVKLPAKKTRG